MGEDLLALLLPEATAAERAEMQRTILALRLVRDDARLREARRVEPSWVRARSELERLERRRRLSALEGLLHAHVSALRGADSFLWLGASPIEHAQAWRQLLAESAPDPPGPPHPAEPPEAVIAGFLAAARRAGAAPEWCELWSLRAAHVLGPPQAAERRWMRALRAVPATGVRSPFAAQLVAGWAAACLDRCAPARALELGSTRPELLARDGVLRRLVGWSALLCGEIATARELLAGSGDPRARLPRPLAQLRSAVPEWAELLQGQEPACTRAGSEPGATGRRDLGAILLAVFARSEGARPRLVRMDAAPSLRARVERSLARGGRPWAELPPDGVRRLHRRGAGAPLPDALAGTRTLALVQAPVSDAAGRSLGWLQLECEHHLLPSSARVEGLARAQGHERWRPSPLDVAAPDVTGLHAADPARPPDPRREFAERLRRLLGPMPGVRALWIESDERGVACVRALGSPAARSEPARMGPEGARASGGKLAAAQAPSGPGQRVDLPLPGARAGRVLGVLALEARAGGGLRDAWVERARAALRALEPLWWATAFRAARIAREGDDLAWDPERRFLGTLEPAVREAAASRVPLLLLGPCGSGRRTLARWIHFRGPSAEEAIVEGAALDPGATCIVDLETLAPVAARALSRALREASGARLVLLGRSAASRPRGPVPELARLDPLSLVVPRLCERRDEIPALVEVLAGNLARREALAPASFTDEAIGDLWRQDWPGEVAELARLVAHLARTCAGRAIGSGEVRTALLARGLEFRARLALRGASPLDLLHAIECTRHRAGSENRARAARYLGWHPATLESRLRGSATPQRGGSAPREQ